MDRREREQLKRIAKPLQSLPIRCKCGGVCFISDPNGIEKPPKVQAFERKNHVKGYAICNRCYNVYVLMHWKKL